VCGNHTLFVKSHSVGENHTLRVKSHSVGECEYCTLPVAIILVCVEITLVRWNFMIDNIDNIFSPLKVSEWQLTRSGREVSFMCAIGYYGQYVVRTLEAKSWKRDNLCTSYFYASECTMYNRLLEIYLQKSWKVAETGRFLHSIFSRVPFRPWFEEWRTERKLISNVSRIISRHCGVRAQLRRFSIVDGSMCVCLKDHMKLSTI
jgi:hypothetical protein